MSFAIQVVNDSRRRSMHALLVSLLAALTFLAGCSSRQSGQVELFGIDESQGTLSRYSEIKPSTERGAFPDFGDPIRSNDDVVTVQVETAFLQNLPATLTGSHDVIIFADVWENAAAGYNTASLTSIVYIGPNQKVPGRLNFRDALAYGPTNFKGHPLRIRFSVVLLQKAQSEKQASAIDIIEAFVSAAAPESAVLTGTVAKTLQGLLKSQPDVKFFDFEVTLCSDQPEGLQDPVVNPNAQAGSTQRVANLPPAPVDAPQWFRYGRFALVETAPYTGEPLKGFENPASIECRDGVLRTAVDRALLPASYLIVRVTPHQKKEQNDILAAASKANADLIKSLSRSDAEIKDALDSIIAQAGTLRDEVLRSKAESIASRIAQNAEAKERKAQRSASTAAATQPVDMDTLNKNVLKALDDPKNGFNAQWKAIVARLPKGDGTQDQQARAQSIGDGVLARWRAKYGGDASPPTPTDTLADQNARDQVVQKIKSSTAATQQPLDVAMVKFAVTDATIEQSADGGAYDSIKVTLTATPAGSAKAKQADVEAAVLKKANEVVGNVTTNTSSPLKKATISNLSALSNAIE